MADPDEEQQQEERSETGPILIHAQVHHGCKENVECETITVCSISITQQSDLAR